VSKILPDDISYSLSLINMNRIKSGKIKKKKERKKNVVPTMQI
jgi:hypothetical protein